MQPGVVLTAFNQYAGAFGLQFGPDPASADRATFGGMFGNNSTGAHSILYGMSSDHLLQAETVLADGQSATFRSQKLSALENVSQQTGLAAQIIATALKLRENSQKVIRENWPKTWRNASGYALNYLSP